MKARLRSNFVCALLTAVVTLPVYAAETMPARLVSVSGFAEVKVVPDEVVIELAVENREKTLASARKNNDEATRKVLNTAKSFALDPKQIQTSYINVTPRYVTDSKFSYVETSKIDHFIVRKDIVLTLRDVNRFEALLTAVLDEGANRVNAVRFNTIELRKHRDRARQLAVIAAREKAVALAQELGQKIGKAVTINEANPNIVPMQPRMMAQNVVTQAEGASPDVGGGTIALGQITISATVNVQFELQ